MLVAVVPVLVGPLQALLALAPAILLALAAALVALFSPRGVKAVLKFLWRQPIFAVLLAVLVVAIGTGYPFLRLKTGPQATRSELAKPGQASLLAGLEQPAFFWTMGEFGGCADDHAWPAKGVLAWSESLAGSPESRIVTPTVQGSHLVAARMDSHQTVLAVLDVDEAIGKRRIGEIELPGGLVHVPIIVAGKAILVRQLGARLQWIGVDLRQVRELWRLDVPEEPGDWPLRCVTDRQRLFGLRRDLLVAIDCDSGEWLYRRRLFEEEAPGGGTGVLSQPLSRDTYSLAVADDLLAVGAGRRWWLLDSPTGKVLDQGESPHMISGLQPASGLFRVTDARDVSILDPVQGRVTKRWSGELQRRQLDLGPALLSYSESGDACRVLAVEDGAERARWTTTLVYPSPVIGKEQVLVPTRDAIRLVSLADGADTEWFRWTRAEDAPATMLWMSRGRLYYGAKDGRIIAVAGAPR